MAVSKTTRLLLRTRLRFKLRDKSAPYLLEDSDYTLYTEAGIRRVVRETECLEDSDTITADGIASAFTLLGSGAVNVADDYLSLRSVDHANATRPLKHTNFESIRYSIINSINTSGNPIEYALFAGGIYFDCVPALNLVLNFRYHKYPTEMADDNASPDAPLDTFDSLIINATLLEMANDIQDAQRLITSDMLEVYAQDKATLMDLVNRGGKRQNAGVVSYAM